MITVEQIDQVMKRTGASYETTRSALETANGDVDMAIRIIENFRFSSEDEKKVYEGEVLGENRDEADKDFVSDIISSIKELWEKGNASSIVVKRGDRILMDMPLTVGTIGIIIAAIPSLIGLGVALVTDTQVLIILENGNIIDLTDTAIKKRREKNKEKSEED